MQPTTERVAKLRLLKACYKPGNNTELELLLCKLNPASPYFIETLFAFSRRGGNDCSRCNYGPRTYASADNCCAAPILLSQTMDWLVAVCCTPFGVAVQNWWWMAGLFFLAAVLSTPLFLR